MLKLIAAVIVLLASGVKLAVWVMKRRAQQDAFKSDVSHETVQRVLDGLEVEREADKDHEKAIFEIVNGVNDDRASELLSKPPETTYYSTVVGPSPSKNGTGKGNTLH